MLRQLFDYVQRLLFLAHETQNNRDDIEELRKRVETLTVTMQSVASELQRLNEREQHEREKLALRLENALLRFERLLPPPDSKKRK